MAQMKVGRMSFFPHFKLLTSCSLVLVCHLSFSPVLSSSCFSLCALLVAVGRYWSQPLFSGCYGCCNVALNMLPASARTVHRSAGSQCSRRFR